MANENMNSPYSDSELEDVFKKLECPFNWNMEKVTKELIKRCQGYKNIDYDQEENLPDVDTDHLFKLMNNILYIYVDVKAKSDEKKIVDDLKKCDDYLALLKKYCHPEISADVAHYILQSTKCFVFKELNMPKELEQTLCEIEKDWQMNSKERSTLNACKSISWARCHFIPVSEFECFIREAIKDNPNCDLYYYILGKNLRRKRRELHFWGTPSEEELNCFLKAYRMTGSYAYGIFVAHIYRDLKKYYDAEQIYLKIFEQNPPKPTILLRLALGLMHMRRFKEARICLDKVEAMQPDRSMYLHYRGIYHLKLNEYKEAAKYFKEACSDNNIGAEKQYLECAVKLDESFDIVQYLHTMLDKYKDLPKEQIQQTVLDLALIYLIKKKDIPNALIYFLKAVESNPQSNYVSKYYVCKFAWIKEKNIYRLLHQEILPYVYKNKDKFGQSCIDTAENLQKYCDQYFWNDVDKTANTFSKFNLKNVHE